MFNSPLIFIVISKSTAQTNEAHYNIQKYFTEEYTMSKQRPYHADRGLLGSFKAEYTAACT